MSQQPATDAPQPPKKRLKVKPSDIIVFAVLIIIVIVLASFLYNQLSLKRNVAQARIVTDKVIQAVEKEDGAAARNQGSTKFKSTYTAEALTKQFKAIELVTSAGTPTVDRQTFDGGAKNAGKTVFIIYKFPPKLAKQPFYIRVAVNDKAGSWQLVSISGSADESSLLVN
jgi:hypothetical protein